MSSLKAYAESHGHHVDLFDFNTVPEVFAVKRAYFAECKAQFPYFKDWNIERNGTEMLAIHQLLYLYSRNRPDYRELVAEVLNMDGRDYGQFLSALDVSRFLCAVCVAVRESLVHPGATAAGYAVRRSRMLSF